MTKSTITREQLLEIIETDHVQCGEASYLARMALAAMDSDPVAWRQPFTGCCVSSIFYQDGSSPLDHGYEPLYAASAGSAGENTAQCLSGYLSGMRRVRRLRCQCSNNLGRLPRSHARSRPAGGER